MARVADAEEWRKSRLELLAKEKELAKLRDQIAAERRELPWVPVTQDYVFEGPGGPCALADLFEGKSQLIIYHFMYGPGWDEGCKSCSFWADQYDAANMHIGARDVAIAVVSRAPLGDFAGFKERMGWRFPWYSSAGSTFNEDFHVSFDAPGTAAEYNFRETSAHGEEMPGLSVFALADDGQVCHTYSCYSRGLDPLNATYQMLDLVPRGRDEGALDSPMAWVRLHDSY